MIGAWLERWQVPLYLLGLAAGALAGLTLPGFAPVAEAWVQPVLAVLLYVTFLTIPIAGLPAALRARRFLTALLAVNFLFASVVVWVITRFIAADRPLLIGALLVLLTPCIDYVIVFTRLAGGDARRLLAATPLLMLAQIVLLPLYLWAFTGGEVLAALDPAPVLSAFLLIIVLPLTAAWLTQAGSRRLPVLDRWQHGAVTGMVPLMTVTLGLVVAAQLAAVSAELGRLLQLVPIYLAFGVVMVVLGLLAGRAAGLPVPAQRALVFSGVTRNSLVVLPLALALPAGFELSGLAVVTQTLVELLLMICLVRLVPRFIRT